MRQRLIVFVSWVAACGGGQPPPPPDPLALPALTDTNPDPRIVEVSLVAAPAQVEILAGKAADVWVYLDGATPAAPPRLPGPMLEARQGDHVIVHFLNQLPEETTVHWHGLRVPNSSDGTPAAQVPVPPGGSFTYEFDVEDAGLFWFHPHLAADVQIERGLYAPLLVRGGVEPEVSAERVLVLDDVKVESTGALSTTTDALDVMLGRQGNVVLVNGRRAPTARAAAGGRERWRIVNTANGRYFNLVVPGRSLLVIGWDGGLLAEPYETDALLIAPGERYDAIVELGGARGDVVTVQTVHHDRGHDVPDPGPLELLRLELTEEAPALAPLPEAWGAIEPVPTDATTPIIELVLSEEEEGLAEPRFFINGEQFPDVTPVDGAPGEVAIWALRNDSEMDHPFHLHGMFFQVLDLDGVAPPHAGWKDTVNVPRTSTLRFAVRYGEPGRWMFHCHILEHAERGMMGELVLAAP